MPIKTNNTIEPRLLASNNQEYISPSSDDSCVAVLINCNDKRINPNNMEIETLKGNLIFVVAIMSNDLITPIAYQNRIKA